MRVIRRFHHPLPLRPGEVALYSVIEDAEGEWRLQWDGVVAQARVPAEYDARPQQLPAPPTP